MRSLTWTKRRKKKKHCNNGGLLWRMRAAVKKAVNGGGRRQAKFQYDPSSYALNFDDGVGDDERAKYAVFHHRRRHDSCEAENCSKIATDVPTLVCVLWMET